MTSTLPINETGTYDHPVAPFPPAVALAPPVPMPVRTTPTVSFQRGDRRLLDQIADEWRTLCAEGPCNDPRLDPEWIELHLRAFEPRARLALITVRIDGRLRGVLPMADHRFGIGPFAFRWYRSVSGVHSAQFDFIHGAGDEHEVVKELWHFLQEWHGWDLLHFRNVMSNSSLAGMMGMAEQEGHAIITRGASNDFFVTIDPESQDFESVIAGRSSKFRRQLRQNAGRLQELGEVRLRVLSDDTDPEAFRKALETFYAIEASGWKGKAGSAIACDASTLAFYNDIADLGLRRGFILIHLLEVDGRPIAASLGIRSGDRITGLKIAYDETLASYSPGHLITAHILADTARRGVKHFDMGGSPAGIASYKSSWTSESRAGFTGLVHQTNLQGRASYLVLTRFLPWLHDQRTHLVSSLASAKHAIKRASSSRANQIRIMGILMLWVLFVAVRHH